jgi:cyanophycin synthetase
MLQRGTLGELMVIREGRRTMPIGWVHLIPATFEGRARMMVANALAAAAAAHAAGAHLHDIRQGLRTFTTNFYQAPGRLNLFELDGMKVVIDYAHNAAGLATVGDFVERITASAPEGPARSMSWTANLRTAVVASPGDRRDEDMRELGRVAARFFDEIVVREDRNLRGRRPGETAGLVADGVREAMGRREARAGSVEIVPGEMEATRLVLDRSRAGDLVVLCVDDAQRVWKELEERRSRGRPRDASGDGQGVKAEEVLLSELDVGP